MTKNRIYSPAKLAFPELHYCFRYLEETVGLDAIETKYGKRFSRDASSVKNWLDIITIKDIFDYTPKTPDIEVCLYRDPTGHIIRKETGCKNLPKIFTASKYVQQQYVCYRLVAKENYHFDFKFIYNSLYYERMLYEIQYSGKLSESKKIRPTLTGENLPHISNFYTPVYYQKTGEGFSLQLACQKFYNTFLGYPYDRFRCGRPDEDHFKCMENCIQESTMKYLNRMPYFSFYEMPIEQKMISQNMLKNDTVLNSLTFYYHSCQSKCPFLLCQYSYCVTNGHAGPILGNTSYSKSSIRIQSPRSPDTSITYVPSISLLDFIIYILSTFSTWFGLNIISLNPVIIVKKYLKKEVKEPKSCENSCNLRPKRFDAILHRGTDRVMR